LLSTSVPREYDADISKGSTYRPIVIAIMAKMENNNKSKINLIRNPFFAAPFASDDFRKTTPSSSSVMPISVGGPL
jgi:hypothetical protein